MRFVPLAVASLGLVSLSLVPSVCAHAQVIVTPPAANGAEGNSNNLAPFDIGSVAPSMRYQQVYNASLFSALNGPAQVSAIVFRPDVFGGAFSRTLPDIQINLSTTTATETTLSSTFANNVGANDTIVVGRGPLSLSSANTGPAGGPKAFDIVISLSTPFLYNPADGNLLLDVRNFGGGFTTAFDAVNTASDGIGRVFSNNGVAATTGTVDSFGLVTQFTFRPVAVPEPGSVALLIGTVTAGAGFLTRRRKTRS